MDLNQAGTAPFSSAHDKFSVKRKPLLWMERLTEVVGLRGQVDESKQGEKKERQEGKYEFKWGPLNMDLLSGDNG